MVARKVKMPKLGMTMTEGRLMKWEKSEGDYVKKDETLFCISTDKVTMEIESPEEGILIKVLYNEGDIVPVGEIVALIGQKDGNVNERIESIDYISATASDTMTSKMENTTKEIKDRKEKVRSIQGNIRATPAARVLARQNGIMINTVLGSGSYGRILRRDVERFIASETRVHNQCSDQQWEDIELSQIQQISAMKMTENFTTVPHFFLSIQTDVSAMLKMLENGRASFKKYSNIRPTFTDVLIWIISRVVFKHPKINASWTGSKVRLYKNVNIGIATGTDQGLVVPVIKCSDKKTFSEIVMERERLIDLARKGKLLPDDIAGGTFTISNLGMFGINSFHAIINSPQSTLLAIGEITKILVKEDNNIVEKPMLNISLSCDHRVLDGVTGAKFLKNLKEVIEEPAKLLDSYLF